MYFSRIVLRAIALSSLIVILTGCTNPKNETVRDTTLHEFRIGEVSMIPGEIQIVPYPEENKLYFQFLKHFDPIRLPDSLAASITIDNRTRNIKRSISAHEIMSNGSLVVHQNEYGSVVTYSSNTLFGKDPVISPGDKVDIVVDFIAAEFDDGSKFFTSGDKFTTYCTRKYFTRSVDNLDTDGIIEAIYVGQYKVTDEDINIISLSDVYDITLDFGFQLNPNTFVDDLKFRFVVNNITKGTSFVLDKSVVDENGRLYVKDGVRGIMSFILEHPATYFYLDGHRYSLEEDPLAEPGDVLNIVIDIIEGKDILGNTFRVQNKRFQIFYSG